MKNHELRIELLGDFFQKIGKILLNLRETTFILFVLSLFILKVGVRGIQPWADFSPVFNFPNPTSNMSTNSIGILIFSKIFGATTKNTFFILNLGLLFFIFTIFYLYLRKNQSFVVTRFLFLVFLGSPIFTVLLGNIGRHDLLTITGIILVFALRNPYSKLLGSLVACFGSPEMYLCALILALACAYILKRNFFIKNLQVAFIFTFVYLVIISFWTAAGTQGQSRFGYILPFLNISIRNFTNNLFLEWYTYLGVLWLIFLVVILNYRKLQSLGILLVLISAMTFNILLVDKTRDFVIATFPMFLVLFWDFFTSLIHNLKSHSRFYSEKVVGLTFLLLFFAPQLEITFEGVPRPPWQWFIEKCVEFLN